MNSFYPKISIILLLVLLSSCKQEFDIKGTWKIETLEQNKAPEMVVPNSQNIDILTFFGPEIWANSEGGNFIFEENGEVSTTIVPQEVLEMCNLKYEYKNGHKSIVFTAEIPQIEEPVRMENPVEVVSENEMIWTLNDFLEVHFSKNP